MPDNKPINKKLVSLVQAGTPIFYRPNVDDLEKLKILILFLCPKDPVQPMYGMDDFYFINTSRVDNTKYVWIGRKHNPSNLTPIPLDDFFKEEEPEQCLPHCECANCYIDKINERHNEEYYGENETTPSQPALPEPNKPIVVYKVVKNEDRAPYLQPITGHLFTPSELEERDAMYPRWVKAVDEVPKRGGQYHVKAGPDKALWSRKRIIQARHYDVLDYYFKSKNTPEEAYRYYSKHFLPRWKAITDNGKKTEALP